SGHAGHYRHLESVAPADHGVTESGGDDKSGAGGNGGVDLVSRDDRPGADNQVRGFGHSSDSLGGRGSPEGDLGEGQPALGQGGGQRFGSAGVRQDAQGHAPPLGQQVPDRDGGPLGRLSRY